MCVQLPTDCVAVGNHLPWLRQTHLARYAPAFFLRATLAHTQVETSARARAALASKGVGPLQRRGKLSVTSSRADVALRNQSSVVVVVRRAAGHVPQRTVGCDTVTACQIGRCAVLHDVFDERSWTRSKRLRSNALVYSFSLGCGVGSIDHKVPPAEGGHLGEKVRGQCHEPSVEIKVAPSGK